MSAARIVWGDPTSAYDRRSGEVHWASVEGFAPAAPPAPAGREALRPPNPAIAASELWRRASHEAGHLAMARIAGFPIRSATIIGPGGASSSIDYQVTAAPSVHDWSSWMMPAALVVSMFAAGAISEALLAHGGDEQQTRGSGSGDEALALNYMRPRKQSLAAAREQIEAVRRETRRLFTTGRALRLARAAATALVARGTMDGDEIAAVLANVR